MREFIDEIENVEEGTDINRENLMAMQGYQKETVSFGLTSITKTNAKEETETINFSDNKIIKRFSGKKIVTQTITFNENGYVKELS